MIHLRNAEKIGDLYDDVSLRYCADDNTCEEIPVQKVAWACANRSFLPQQPQQTVSDIFDEFYGELV